jgi:tellurite resistance protein TehA-like permease
MATTTTPATTAAEPRLPGYARLFPGYFALVMATGIVSIAAFQQGFVALAEALLWANLAFYTVLWALTIARALRYPRLLLADLATHQKGSAFLTIVAGTSVLGSQCTLLMGWTTAAFWLWVLAAALWAVLLYGFFVAITVREPKPTLDEGLNGAWLLMIVSTESLAVLGALVAPTTSWVGGILFLSLMAHLAGLMLYILVIGMIVYRWTFVGLTPAQVTPPYWINMGALAITTLAAANLIAAGPAWEMLASMHGFLEGTMLLAWSFATWWIPILVAVGVWRHVIQRHPLVYDPQYWSLVFPLGMYAACTFKLDATLGVPFLAVLPKTFLWVALAAWTLTAVGMALALLGGTRARRTASHA